jgi:hypothetical protein
MGLLSLHEPEEEGEEGLPHLPLWDKAHLQQRAHQGGNQLRRIYMSLRYSDRDLIKEMVSQNGRNMILDLFPFSVSDPDSMRPDLDPIPIQSGSRVLMTKD